MSVVLVSPAIRENVASGTELRLTAASVQNVVSVILSAPAANTGTIYVGDADVSTVRGIAIIKGTTQVINAPQGDYLDIHNMYFDAATSGDDLLVSYLVRV